MSILLEALKKSEQRRQLGQTPTLQTNLEDQPPSQVTLTHWAPLSLLALSACAMAWFGWQQFREPGPGPTAGVPAVVAQTAADPQPRTPTESFQSEAGDQEDTPVTSAITSAEDEDVRERLNQTFNEYTADNIEGEAVEPPGNLTVAPEPAELETRAELSGADPRQSRNKPRPSRAEREQSEAESGMSELEPHIAEPISYWELPQGVRDDLPEIKITVLVYSDKPDDRFLLTNGQRVVEKDELENGLVLDEIRRDGAVFLYRKYRFLVKG